MKLKSLGLPLWSQVPLLMKAVGLILYLTEVGAVLQGHFKIHSEALISSVGKEKYLDGFVLKNVHVNK